MAKNKKGGITSLPGTLNILSLNINHKKSTPFLYPKTKHFQVGGLS